MFFLLFLLKFLRNLTQLTTVGPPPRVSAHLGCVLKRFAHLIPGPGERVLGQRPSEVRRGTVGG